MANIRRMLNTTSRCVGYGTVIATFLFSIYYGVIIAWMLLYFVYSMFKTLPWSTCDNDWNIKETCIVTKTARKVVENFTTTVSTIVSAATTMAPTVLRNETSAEQFWKAKIPAGNAQREAVIFGKRLDASAAKHLGIVDDVTPQETLMSAAKERIATLLGRNLIDTTILKAMKEDLYDKYICDETLSKSNL